MTRPASNRIVRRWGWTFDPFGYEGRYADPTLGNAPVGEAVRAGLYGEPAGPDQLASTQPSWAIRDTDYGWVPIPGLTAATVPQQAALWPDGSGQQDRSTWPTWSDFTETDWTAIPGLSVASVAEQAALWPDLMPVAARADPPALAEDTFPWSAVAAPPFDPAPIVPALGEAAVQALAAAWSLFLEEPGWTPIPGLSVADVAQQGGLWPDPSGQDGRSLWPTWFEPEPQQAALLQAKPSSADAAYAARVVADGPTSYFQLNELRGYSNETSRAWGTSYDRINATRYGTWFGAYGAQTAGALTGDPDPAYRSEAAADGRMSVPAANSPGVGSGDFTAEIWLRTSETGVLRIGASRKNSSTGTDPGWALGKSALDVAQARLSDGTTAIVLSGSKVITDGIWHHVVLTRQGANAALWVDGVNEASSAAGPTLSVDDANVALTLGGYNGAGSWPDGMDEFALYTRKLADGEITNHYVLGRQIFAPTIGPEHDLQAPRAWFAPDDAFEGLTPPVAPFNPAPIVPALGEADALRLAAAWAVVLDELGWVAIPGLTAATVPEQAALWSDPSGQQDRELGPVWSDRIETDWTPIPGLSVASIDQLAALWPDSVPFFTLAPAAPLADDTFPWSAIVTAPFDPAPIVPTLLDPDPLRVAAAWGIVLDDLGWTPIPGLTPLEAQAALWQEQPGQERALGATWFALELEPVWVPIPGLTVASVPEQAPLWEEQPGQERSLWPAWWFPEDQLVFTPPAPFNPAPIVPALAGDVLSVEFRPIFEPDSAWVPIPGLTTADVAAQAGLWPDPSGQQDRDVRIRWFVEPDDTLGVPPFAITTATVAQQAALWPEQPGQDRSLQPVWWRPEDAGAGLLPPPPPIDPATQFPWLFEPEPPARRDFTPDALEPGAGPLADWLYLVWGGCPPTTTPDVLIDATTGDPYIYLSGPFIARAD